MPYGPAMLRTVGSESPDEQVGKLVKTDTKGNTMDSTKETAWVWDGKKTKAKTVEVEWLGIQTCMGIWNEPDRIAYWKKDLADVYWIPVGGESL